MSVVTLCETPRASGHLINRVPDLQSGHPIATNDMKLTINGNEKEFEETTLPIPDLLIALGLAGQPALVELNGDALLQKELPSHSVKDGDTLEIVRMVAGG